MIWVEGDGAVWTWVHGLVIPIKHFYFRNLYTSITGDYLFIFTSRSTYFLSLLKSAGISSKYS